MIRLAIYLTLIFATPLLNGQNNWFLWRLMSGTLRRIPSNFSQQAAYQLTEDLRMNCYLTKSYGPVLIAVIWPL